MFDGVGGLSDWKGHWVLVDRDFFSTFSLLTFDNSSRTTCRQSSWFPLCLRDLNPYPIFNLLKLTLSKPGDFHNLLDPGKGAVSFTVFNNFPSR